MKLKKIIDCYEFIFFLLSSDKGKNRLIHKNARLFIDIQKKAKKINELGDVRSSMEINSESYKYLWRFVRYCKILKIDVVKRLKYHWNNERI